MLAARPAEGEQGVVGGVVAPAQRDGADRVGHPLVGDLQEALEQGVRVGLLSGLDPEALADRFEGLAGGGGVDGDGEARRVETAQQEVDVGDGERAAGPVAGGPGVGARAPGADVQRPGGESTDRPSTGCHALDSQGRREQVGVAHRVLELVLVVPVEAGDVGAGASHVEGEDPGEARAPRRRGGAHHTPRRPAQQAVLGAVAVGAEEPPGAGHGVERPSAQALLDVSQVAADHGREVGVDGRRLRPGQELDPGRQLGGDRDLLEPALDQEVPEPLLVAGVLVGVQQGHGGHPHAPAQKLSHRRFQGLQGEVLDH